MNVSEGKISFVENREICREIRDLVRKTIFLTDGPELERESAIRLRTDEQLFNCSNVSERVSLQMDPNFSM